MAERFNQRSMNRNNVSAPSPRAESGGGCGCQNQNGCAGQGGACKTLLRRLQTLDFSIVDTVLYLDADPHSAEALAYYQKLVAEREGLIRQLSESCHMPMTHMDNGSADAWHWNQGPWPWQAEAN